MILVRQHRRGTLTLVKIHGRIACGDIWLDMYAVNTVVGLLRCLRVRMNVSKMALVGMLLYLGIFVWFSDLSSLVLISSSAFRHTGWDGERYTYPLPKELNLLTETVPKHRIISLCKASRIARTRYLSAVARSSLSSSPAMRDRSSEITRFSLFTGVPMMESIMIRMRRIGESCRN